MQVLGNICLLSPCGGQEHTSDTMSFYSGSWRVKRPFGADGSSDIYLNGNNLKCLAKITYMDILEIN